MYINVCGGRIVTSVFQNPFRPGAGHPPPYLAGREQEKQEFQRLLQQQAILDNLVLTGLRGVGKTVLLNTLEPMAIPHRWLWLGNDLSEAASLNEENLTHGCARTLQSLQLRLASAINACGMPD